MEFETAECPECGAELPITSESCFQCGAKFDGLDYENYYSNNDFDSDQLSLFNNSNQRRSLVVEEP